MSVIYRGRPLCSLTNTPFFVPALATSQLFPWPCFYVSQKSKRKKAGWKSWQVAKAVAQNRILVRERDGLALDWPSFYLLMF